MRERDERDARREGAAEAWDAGWCAGVSRFTQQHLPATENPYRNVAAATYICRHGKYRSEHDCDDHRDRAAALRVDA